MSDVAQEVSGGMLRVGQRAFNILAIQDPLLAESVRASAVDPFFDDSRLADFYSVVDGSSAAGLLPDGSRRRRLLLVDGHAVAYRAFFAVPETLVAPSGEPVGVVQGFFSMLAGVVASRRSAGDSFDMVVVCFDAGRDVRRTEAFAGYKASRREAPVSLRPQVDLVKEVVAAAGGIHLSCEGVEADDLIASVCARAVELGFQVDVLSGDRDLMQLVSPRVRVLAPGRSMRDLNVIGSSEVLSRFGVPPFLYLDLAALRGDVSDDLPGVPGVGVKTAARLLMEFGSCAGVYADVSAVSSAGLRAKLVAHREAVERNLSLMALDSRRELPSEVMGALRGVASAASGGSAAVRSGLPAEAAAVLSRIGLSSLNARVSDAFSLD